MTPAQTGWTEQIVSMRRTNRTMGLHRRTQREVEFAVREAVAMGLVAAAMATEAAVRAKVVGAAEMAMAEAVVMAVAVVATAEAMVMAEVGVMAAGGGVVMVVAVATAVAVWVTEEAEGERGMAAEGTARVAEGTAAMAARTAHMTHRDLPADEDLSIRHGPSATPRRGCRQTPSDYLTQRRCTCEGGEWA